MKRFDTPEAQALYNRLRTQTGSYYEVKVICGEGQDAQTYGMDKLKSVRVKPALFENDGPQIGGVHSTQCEVKLYGNAIYWPRMAKYDVQIRLVEPHDAEDDEQDFEHSDWFSMGVFYTDERHLNRYGNLEIASFDEMLMLEQSWTDKITNEPDNWPITSKAAAGLIQEATGIVIENINSLDNTTAYIGLDTTSTARDVMKSIAVGNGGNWVITSEGTYKLVVLKNLIPGSAAIAGIAIAGVSVVGDGEIDVSGGAVDVNSVGFAAKDIVVNSSQIPVSGVEIRSPDGTVAFAGNTDSYVIKAECDFASTEIANVCLTQVSGYVYTPFSATTARLDPLAEVGDLVYIAGNTYPIVTLDWNIAPHITADISAPFEEEIDHEYTTMSEAAKSYQKAVKYTDDLISALKTTYISQTAESIVLGALKSYVDNDTFNDELKALLDGIYDNYYNKEDINGQYNAIDSRITTTANGIESSITTFYNGVNGEISAIKSYITYKLMDDRQGNHNVGTVVIGVLGDPDNKTSIRITNEEIGLYYGDECISYWNQDNQLTPKALKIPVGGKFTLGSIMFQPRVSGNMSLMWVGETNGN